MRANSDQQEYAHEDEHLWQEELRTLYEACSPRCQEHLGLSLRVPLQEPLQKTQGTDARWVCGHETCLPTEAPTFKAQDLPRLVSMAVQGSFTASLDSTVSILR